MAKLASDKPILLVALAPDADAARWVNTFADAAPGFAVQTLEDAPDPDRVRYVAAWKHPHGGLAPYESLKAIFSLGAGVDHLLADPALPAGVPVVRVVDPDLTDRMSEWVLLQVLMHHRQQRLYDWQQSEKIWAEDAFQPAAREVRVGVMGLGVLGQDAARKLRIMGFDVAGWSRSTKTMADIETFAGPDGFEAFLARTQVLVVLLPHTPATEGILDAKLFAALARDSHFGGPILINAGRGALQKEADILAALDDGTLRAASLDVFETEPLPESSPLWHHPAVTITPHNSAISAPQALTAYIARMIAGHESGAALVNVVDRAARY